MKPTQLRRYLTDTRTDCFPDQDWLATASYQPLHLVRARLIGLTDADHDPTRQRRHARLHRHHRDAARCAISDATRILRWWTATPASTFSTATTCVEDYLGIYPALIDMARILADARCQIFSTPAATVARCRAIDSVTSRLAVRFPEYRDQRWPIEQWIDDQQIISAGLRRLAPAVIAQHDDGRPLPPRGEQARGYKQQAGSSTTHNACNASGRTR